MLRRIGTIAALLISMPLLAAPIPVPEIEPGYSPREALDEQGLWMEFEEYEQAIRNSALLVKDPEINGYVRDVACQVAGDYCRDLRIYVVRNPYFNASMAANGVMQVWTGLLVRVSSEDELAAVLGHELAHYTQLHSLDRLRKMKRDGAVGAVFDMGLLLLTGYSIPGGQLTALASRMAFSRASETEADRLGAAFMAQGGFDPAASARVWEMIADEESSAVVKRKKGNLFTNTHPAPANRIVSLSEFVGEHFAELEVAADKPNRHLDILNNHYTMLMEDQLDTNRFGRTEAILERHQQIGVRQELVDFFHGEMYRQRDEEGDAAFAREAYSRATQGDEPVPEAYMNLGYINLKEDDLPQAQFNFRKYLDLVPDADDRAMIEFYLQES